MEMLHYSFRLLAFSQGLFLLGYLLLYQRNRASLILIATIICLCGYLLSPILFWQFGDGLALSIAAFLGTAVPAVLWLLGNRFFNDQETAPWPFWAATVVYISLWLINEVSLVSLSSSVLEGFIFDLLVQAIKLCLVIHVAYMALAGRDSDLNRERLKIRTPLALGAASATSVVILVELWLKGPSPMVLEAFGSGLMFLLALSAGLYLFRMRSNLPLVAQAATKVVPANTAEAENIELIKKTMESDRFFARHGATLSELAQLLNIPSHRLRPLVNGYLGFQNFNQFLNHYRIEEASARLLSQKHLPILSIALDVGFRSMSSFNKAFKDIHGLTPSNYRNKAFID